VTEAEARSLLRGGDRFDGLETWIADQRWAADPNGWRVVPAHKGWRFRVEPAPGDPRGLHVVAEPPGGGPVRWRVGPPPGTRRR
jgi:hypothetical protein